MSDKGGTLTPSSGYTNANGDFTTTFTAPSVPEQTNVRITATASKSGYNDGSDSEYAAIYLPTLSVAVTANPTTIQSSQTSTITTRITYDGNPASGATVTLSSDKGGTLSTTSGNTDSNGYFTATFTAPTVTTETTITITANATKVGYLSGQNQAQIIVNPSPPSQPDPTLWISLAILVIVVLTAVAGGVVIARRKSRKSKQAPTLPSQS